VAKLDRKLTEIDAAEFDAAAQASADTVESRQGAFKWVALVEKSWPTLVPNARRVVLAMMSNRILLGEDGLPNIEWHDASTLATRFASGKLPSIEGNGENLGALKVPKPPRK
jgi:hypothetical protein